MTDTDVRQPEAAMTTSPTLAFALERIQMNPEITFPEVRDAGKLAGLLIYPVVYGKARGMLGLAPLVTSRRRVPTPEPAHAEPAVQAAEPEPSAVEPEQEPSVVQPRPRTRKPRSAPTTPAISDLVGHLRAMEEARERMYAALLQIRRVVEDALS